MPSTIQWTDETWNPVRGCSLVSAGCKNCYAMKQAHRFSGPDRAYEGLTKLGPDGPRWTGEIRLVYEKLDEPLHWKTPRRIFVNSMSDLFHKDIPDSFILACFTTMAKAHWHTFQVLTKRPERMMSLLRKWQAKGLTLREGCGVVLPNVWLGVSCENQDTLLDRVPWLLETPAAIRFISYEPALAPIDLHAIVARDGDGPARDLSWIGSDAAIDWVIVGGESGLGARYFDIQWARDVIRQCAGTMAKVFIKQLGKVPMETIAPGCDRLLNITDKKGGEMSDWPEDLRVREFPKVVA